jgi:hypothetical protein
MKGIEGLALKYVLIILVAALVIGTAVSIMTEFTSQVTASGGQLLGTTTTGFNKTNEKVCTSFDGCIWNSTTQLCDCG